ncbi:MAG: hypothetical protein WD604_15530 [Balneolaceae bacterium]
MTWLYQLAVDNEKEINSCYSELTDGGTLIEPLKDAFGNALFGVVQDKFGKVWMLHHEKQSSQ